MALKKVYRKEDKRSPPDFSVGFSFLSLKHHVCAGSVVGQDKEKAPVSLQGPDFTSPANYLDGLNTAAFFAVGYRANTKSFSPHGVISFQPEYKLIPCI